MIRVRANNTLRRIFEYLRTKKRVGLQKVRLQYILLEKRTVICIKFQINKSDITPGETSGEGSGYLVAVLV